MKKAFYALTTTLLFSSLLLFGSWQLVAAASPPAPWAGASPLMATPATIDPEAQNGDPDSSVVYHLTITNTGITSDTFYVAVSSTSGFPTILTPTIPLTIEAGLSDTWALQVDIPPFAISGTVATHVLVVTSTLVVTPTYVTATTTVNPVDAPPTVTPPFTSGNGNPAQAITYTFTLTNESNFTDTFDLAVSGNFPALLSTHQLEVGGYESQQWTLTVTIPTQALVNQVSVNPIYITPTLSGSMLTVPVTTTVNALPALPQVTPLSAVGYADPGETITYTFTLTNHSNLLDTFDLGVTQMYPAQVISSPLTVAGYMSGTFALQVTVPVTALSGQMGQNLVTITPTVSPAPALPLTTTTWVNPVYISPTLTPVITATHANLGQVVPYTFTLTNESNIADTFTVTAAGLWLTTSPVTAVNNLAPNASAELYLSVTVPFTALAEQQSAVTLTVSSAGAGMAQAAVTTTANEQLGVSLAPNRTLGVEAGSTVVFTHIVTNTGNSSQQVQLVLDSSASITPTLSDTSVTLAAGASRVVTVTYPVLVGALDQTVYTTTLTATLANHPTVTSQATSAATVGLRVGLAAHPLQLAQEVSAGQTVTYLHTITNTGNRVDTVSVEVQSNSNGNFAVSLSASQLTIAPQSAATLVVSVTAPATAVHLTTNTTTIRLTSGNQNNLTLNLVETTTVRYYFINLPLITRPYPPPQWENVEVSLTLDVRALSIEVCPTDENILLAGFANGLWAKQNGSFSHITDLPTGEQALVTDIVLTANCEQVFVSIYNQGIWQGSYANGQWGNWQPLEVGEDIKQTRRMVLVTNTSNTTLLAGGDFGLVHWTGSRWEKIAAIEGVVMDLAISNPQTNEGTLYAVVWFQPKIWTASATAPTNWSSANIGDLPEPRVLSVQGNIDQSSVMVGTSNGTYRYANGTWALVEATPAHGFWFQNNQIYMGLAQNQGVHLGSATGAFTAINTGLSPAPTIVYRFARVTSNQQTWLYAATTTGIWRYGVLTD